LAQTGKIFICYRRGDVPGDVRGIYDRLVRAFGNDNVFMDVDRLLPGQRFDLELDKALAQCDILLVVIGPRWIELLSDHVREGDRDFVHDEIASALEKDIIIISTLVGQEREMPSLPQKEELQEDIRALTQFQKHDIAHESFPRDTEHLISAIKKLRSTRDKPRRWAGVSPELAIGGIAIAAAMAIGIDMWWRANGDTQIHESGIIVAPSPDSDVARKAAADCDRLAASPADSSRPSRVPGTEFC
jgi:TIR domain